MTAIVGIICKKGVVIGSDSSTTFTAGQMRTIEQRTKKVHIIHDKYILAGTGAVGLGQRFHAEVEKVVKNPHNSSLSPMDLCCLITKMGITNFSNTGVQPNQFGALLAFPCKDDHHLCEFDQMQLQPELKSKQIWYVSMGSGQTITDPFLGFVRRNFWKDGELPDLKQGIFSTIWTLQHAIELNTGGINGPIQVGILEYTGEKNKITARLLSDEEIEEHVNYIKELERHIGSFTLGGEANSPNVPKPPANLVV